MSRKFVGTIKHLRRLKNSMNGNPRYEITFNSGTFITSSDHSFCYKIENPGYRVDDAVEVTLTRAGRGEIISGKA